MDWQNSKNDSIAIRRQLLNEIRRSEGISRVALAQVSGMTRPTVSSIVTEFINAGLVRELGKGRSTGGKRPIMLALQDEEPCVAGIAIGEDYVIRAVSCDLSGRIRTKEVMEYSNTFDSIRDTSVALVRNLQKTGAGLKGIGVAVSGLVDASSGEVRSSRTLDICHRGFGAAVSQETGLPVYLENRAASAALAESLYGAGRHYRDMVYLSSGRGIGLGIVVNGKLFRGSHGAAGELGDVPFKLDPKVPSLERRLQPETLTCRASELLREKLDYPAFLSKLKSGNPVLEELLFEVAETLARALRGAIALLDPEALVLGGQLLDLGPVFFDRFSELMASPEDEERFGRTLAVCKSELGEFGGALGGATVLLERIFHLQPV